MRPLYALALMALIAGCSEAPPPEPATPAPLAVETLQAEVEDLDGMDSWVFDLRVTNTSDSAFAGRYFVLGESPTSSPADAGIYPLSAKLRMGGQVDPAALAETIGPDLLNDGAELSLDGSEAETIEGGIVVQDANQGGFDRARFIVYDAEGRRVFDAPLSSAAAD